MFSITVITLSSEVDNKTNLQLNQMNLLTLESNKDAIMFS